jgi:hypothetical protein
VPLGTPWRRPRGLTRFPHRQVTQRVAPEVQTVEMPHRHLVPLVPRIVGGGLVPMPVGGKARVTLQLWNVGQPITDLVVHDRNEPLADLQRQIAPARTAQRSKVVFVARHLLELQAMFLQEPPPTGAAFHDAGDSHAQPLIVGKFRAVPEVDRVGQQRLQGLEERVVHTVDSRIK